MSAKKMYNCDVFETLAQASDCGCNSIKDESPGENRGQMHLLRSDVVISVCRVSA
eukprot:CAMPEP_0173394636 /NCGR_PEP_ID=MMETSP1356-20130122/28651_1 /TAXON_ID=77927 ORGANISM="Hemiselmis virescens, Strain PCC157" /NCGR_SAMPLE_ID=MMETSP1356 /ASSEMBLY_ACC=CAM_ASM_000847 /LENGTH=54 /DNA_ID=CAMNT_0014353077 /DNA_START=169 /DNA_END=330 /DNA_ORIENTATION=+